MELSELVPRDSKFFLRKADREFTIRPFELRDEIWLQEKYGDAIQDVFEKINMVEISRIAFRQLTIEDKQFFKKQEVKIVNEEGDEITEILGGLDLFRSLISGWGEKTAIIEALGKSLGMSRPEQVEHKSAEKKTVNQ